MKARIGIIGCGWWATHAHIPAVLANPDANLCAIADPNDENRLRAARTFGIPSGALYTDAAAMLKDVELDAVIVAVPHFAHESVARMALEHDLHLLLEKPMTIRPADARALAALAKARHRELIVGYPWHFNRQALALRDAIGAGRIGTLEYVSSQYASTVRDLYRGATNRFREVAGYTMINPPGSATYSDPEVAGGGQAQTQVTHAAALLFHMTGLRPAKVAAVMASFELQVDLVDVVAIGFSNGAVGSLGSTGSMLPGHRESLKYELFGNEGHISFDVSEGVALIYLQDGIVEPVGGAAIADPYPERLPANNLVDVTLGRAENGSPASIGILAVEFVDAMYRSARDGRVVSLSD